MLNLPPLPSPSASKYTGGRLIVDALRKKGVERIFCVPGESYLPVLDALVDVPEISVVSARHEGAAANMAEADGKLTGRPGICFVTRGPGATHAAVGVHTAHQDSTPMILFIGQVATWARDREGFQEVDYRTMFSPLAKWVAEIDNPARIAEYVNRAFQLATAGRPGPVVLSLPEDMLSARAVEPIMSGETVPVHAAPLDAYMQAFVRRLAQSSKPLMIVGGTGWTSASLAAVQDFAERTGLPIAASWRRQDLFDNRHGNYVGHLGLGIDPTLADRVKSADLLIAVGSRLGENTTSGYTLLDAPVPRQSLIHIHNDPEELGRVYRPEIAICCSLAAFGESLRRLDVPKRSATPAWLADARQAYLEFSSPADRTGDCVDLAAVVRWLSHELSDDAIISNGAGNYTVWIHRYFRYRKPRTELAPTSGAMGYGVPAAISASLRYPDREVIAFAGDGCFLMYAQEIATAIQYGAKPIILIVNNNMYGTIRMHQERRFPGRVIATRLINPDFVALASSFGAYAELVERTDEFAGAFRRARATGCVAVLELKVDPNQITPTARIKA